jgi:NAD(P)H-hydrate epimerase
MKIVTSNQMRELDQAAIDAGIPGEVLMQTAGEGLAAAIRRLAEMHQLLDAPVLFVAGCGNNGGDAFVAAQCLHEEDCPVECWLAGPEDKLHGDALTHFRHMKKAGVPILVIEQSADWAYAAECGTDAEIIVDGLLGTGASGGPRGIIGDAIAFVEGQADRALVVAIDMPSAMAVRADLTVTMGFPKIECVQSENMDAVGRLEVVDIGIPPESASAIEGCTDAELIQPSDLIPLFPRRSRDTHKGDYGHVLCAGGSKGFSGAIAMASRAALRMGAGLVSTFVPESIQNVVASAVPEAMVHSVLPDIRWTTIVAGPGMGRTATTREQILLWLETSTVPLVLDADAVCVLSDHLEAVASAKCPVILTPHPGEFATLFGIKADEVQEDRFALARMAADRLDATIVLKGTGTVVAAPGRPLAINMTGNPGMASGGSGDVLAGMLAGLAGQGMAPFEAACAAVWLHGHAGDLAAAEKAQASIIASDLIDKIPDAVRAVSCR